MSWKRKETLVALAIVIGRIIEFPHMDHFDPLQRTEHPFDRADKLVQQTSQFTNIDFRTFHASDYLSGKTRKRSALLFLHPQFNSEHRKHAGPCDPQFAGISPVELVTQGWFHAEIRTQTGGVAVGGFQRLLFARAGVLHVIAVASFVEIEPLFHIVMI